MDKKTYEELLQPLKDMINKHSETITKLVDISNRRKHKIDYLESLSKKTDNPLNNIFRRF